MQESLVGSMILSYIAYVPTVMCVYIRPPLVVAASRNHTLLNSVAALIEINHDTSAIIPSTAQMVLNASVAHLTATQYVPSKLR